MVTQSAAQTANNSSPREKKFRKHLWELYSRFLTPNAAEKIWWQLLTQEERARLGSLEESFQLRGRGVSIYARAKHLSLEAATVDLSHYWGYPEIDYLYLCQELFHFTGERIGPLSMNASPRAITASTEKPYWDSDRNQLWYGGEIVRQVRRGSVPFNIILILDAFEEMGWPTRIKDPLPGPPDPERLRATISSLNGPRGSVNRIRLMKFSADGTGNGVIWEPLSSEDQILESI